MGIIKWTGKPEAFSQIFSQAGVYLFSSLWEVNALGQTLSLALSWLVLASVSGDISSVTSLPALPGPAVRE